ncbi:MAG: RagB/SusD family nutrient uptake outer membrane protein [Butyricimonas faecihominis]
MEGTHDGILDILSQTYSSVVYDYNKALVYDYQDETIKKVVDTLWSSNYYAIANCNYLLQNISKHGGVLSEKVRPLVEGEALALRAFLHFDLLRGFAPSYKMGANDPGIPYVKEATNQVVTRSTVAATLDLILGDLKKAQELLRPVDPIGPSFGEYEEEDEYSADDYVTDDGFWLYRKSRFNYYGVTALMARVYLYKEDMTNALACAEEVIHSGRFACVTDKILQDEPSKYTFVESVGRHEYITSLYVYDLKKGRSDLYFKDLATYACVVGEERKLGIFGGTGLDLDVRSKRLFDIPSGSKTEYVIKYITGNRIPLLKLSEMYLIAAEASGDIRFLETLRGFRGYAGNPLPADANLLEELRKEYQKEFIAEGQLFYFYKRQNMITIPFTAQTMNRATYVFPMPDNELEFGNIQ